MYVCMHYILRRESIYYLVLSLVLSSEHKRFFFVVTYGCFTYFHQKKSVAWLLRTGKQLDQTMIRERISVQNTGGELVIDLLYFCKEETVETRVVYQCFYMYFFKLIFLKSFMSIHCTSVKLAIFFLNRHRISPTV